MQQQQQEEYMRQQMMQQEQQRQQEEWMRQQQMMQQQQQQSLMPQQTGYGSNNPFAPSAGQQSLLGSINNGSQQQQQPSPQPSSSFLPVPSVSMDRPISPAQTPQAQAVQPKPAFVPSPAKNDGQHSQLAGLLARGREDGLDTFGNMGNLREYFPVPHASWLLLTDT